MLIIRNVVRLHFVDHERKRTLLTRIRRLCTATATLRSCSRRTDSVGREIHQLRIALQTAQTRSEGPHWLYNKRGPGRESVQHNHLFGVLQGPHRKKKILHSKSKERRMRSFSLYPGFSLSLSLFHVFTQGTWKEKKSLPTKATFHTLQGGSKMLAPSVYLPRCLTHTYAIISCIDSYNV